MGMSDLLGRAGETGSSRSKAEKVVPSRYYASRSIFKLQRARIIAALLTTAS